MNPASPSDNSPRRHVVVIGGGWAGLAAATELGAAGIPVTVIESARQPGGRARTLDWQGLTLDNGQHLLIGAYREILRLMRLLDLDADALLQRRPLELYMLLPGAQRLRIRAAPLPAPFHIVFALLSAHGMPLRERLRALRFCASLLLRTIPAADDISVATMLERGGQSPFLIEQLWEPLCLATLNTPLDAASARVFRRVLMDAFNRRRHDADLLIPCRDLGTVLPGPACRHIRSHGGEIRLGQRVTSLSLEHDRVTAVTLADGTVVTGSHFIIATPPWISARLLRPHRRLAALSDTLERFEYAPICTLYVRYPPATTLPQAMIGMTGTLCQWVFDRAITGHPGLMAVVISAAGTHMALDNESLIRTVTRELAATFPHWPAHLAATVIREKRATFTCLPGIDAWRPATATAVDNLWLAGDYTDTGYPATLEGAVISGMRCAAAVGAATR